MVAVVKYAEPRNAVTAEVRLKRDQALNVVREALGREADDYDPMVEKVAEALTDVDFTPFLLGYRSSKRDANLPLALEVLRDRLAGRAALLPALLVHTTPQGEYAASVFLSHVDPSLIMDALDDWIARSEAAEANDDQDSQSPQPEVWEKVLRQVSARIELAERARERLVWAAAQADVPQRTIARNLRIPQTSVHRLIKRVSADKTLQGESARDLILTYACGLLSREDLIDRLAADARPGQHDPTGGDGYRRGTRDVIERAVGEGLLDEDDWNALVERARNVPDLLAAN